MRTVSNPLLCAKKRANQASVVERTDRIKCSPTNTFCPLDRAIRSLNNRGQQFHELVVVGEGRVGRGSGYVLHQKSLEMHVVK